MAARLLRRAKTQVVDQARYDRVTPSDELFPVFAREHYRPVLSSRLCMTQITASLRGSRVVDGQNQRDGSALAARRFLMLCDLRSLRRRAQPSRACRPG